MEAVRLTPGAGVANIETQEYARQSNMPAMKARHDKVMERLAEAIPDSLGTKLLDQTCSGMQRPDIVILSEEIDITCPCECGKEDKYAAIKGKLQDRGYGAYLDAFVVGTLGIWDPENASLMQVVGIGRKYGTLFKKLCCRDAISGSYDVCI